jgi:hypothetical protein
MATNSPRPTAGVFFSAGLAGRKHCMSTTTDQVVKTCDVLEAIRVIRRVGRQRVMIDIEKREPDLAEHLLEELTAIHRRLAQTGASARQLRRLYRRVESLGLVMILSLQAGQSKLWMDFILTAKPYKSKSATLTPPTPLSTTPPVSADGGADGG